ncbi:MAG: hypothetical protein AB7U20_15060 [Planctomycetaceae bacterium]
MPNFDELAASRRTWIDDVLKPWCRTAPLKDLKRAEREWGDIAGKVDPQATLWAWAWSRFPGLIVEGLPGFDETYAVTITLRSGERQTGYPDARKSRGGILVLVGEGSELLLGPYSIDDITSLERADRPD